MFKHLLIQNPKRENRPSKGRATWYPYYAGFSFDFAHSLIASTEFKTNACIVDPWNGSGTTTAAAVLLGYCTQGFDLNPVMVIAAKARMLNKREKSSLWPIAADIINKARHGEFRERVDDEDPLTVWFVPNSTAYIREIEKTIQLLLVDTRYQLLAYRDSINFLSDIAAFFYLALFRAIRKILKKFFVTNPTWIKKPTMNSARLRTKHETLLQYFEVEVKTMIAALDDILIDGSNHASQTSIKVASSDALPLKDKSANMVLTSPPYCTRIDYAVATMSELAILGYVAEEGFQDLRRKLIGSATVPAVNPSQLKEWGPTCNAFLNKMLRHNSKASKSYYYKNHAQYFNAIFKSIGELHRSLADKGLCVIVVQDSFYKDVHNDLPRVFIEMASAYGLELGRREDFSMMRTMAGINPAVRKYRKDVSATESVLCFKK